MEALVSCTSRSRAVSIQPRSSCFLVCVATVRCTVPPPTCCTARVPSDRELLELLRHKPNPIAYDGFEPSGRMHIAQVRMLGRHAWWALDVDCCCSPPSTVARTPAMQGVLKAINVNKLTLAGCTFKFWCEGCGIRLTDGHPAVPPLPSGKAPCLASQPRQHR